MRDATGAEPANEPRPVPRPETISAPGGYQVEAIADADGFRALRDDWNALLQRSSSDCLFLTWEWLYLWWLHLGGAALSILAVRRDGELVGIAPFMETRGFTRRLELLGTGTVGSDYLDLVADRAHEPGVLGALRGWLDERGIAVTASQVLRSGSLMERLLAALALNRWEHTSTVINVCPYAPLGGHSWDSYLGELSSSHRYNFRRRLRQLEKRYRVELVRAGSEEERQRGLETLVALHLRRWSERHGSDAFSRAALIDFHHDVSRRALENGWLRLYVLRLDGRPAAALYGFKYGDRFYFYQSGFDPDYGKHSVGLVMMGLSIRDAIGEGAREYDLLHGDERYKFSWASRSREIARFDAYPPGLAGAALRRGQALTQASKQAARSWLPESVIATIAAARSQG
jgi:CelD/BcsL family acetyltransferase involved in cellulose biosynthesis